MKQTLFATLLVFLSAIVAGAAVRKPIAQIDADGLTNDTQVLPKNAGDDHVALLWWVPVEFWESLLTRDPTTSEADKSAMLEAMSGVSLLAVVQADISVFGAFDFYSKEEISGEMKITYTNGGGDKVSLVPLEEINTDLSVILGVFKPILGAAMGNLGNNMHFFVLEDKAKSSSRLVDPYYRGKLDFTLARRGGAKLHANIELPLNSLFVPRKCPNGKEAHITWNYCPWTGRKLED